MSKSAADDIKKKWLEAMGKPSDGQTGGKAEIIKRFSRDEFDGEIYIQENGSGKHQRVMMLFPKNMTEKAPAVVVPFYFPEAMMGGDPVTGESLESFKGVEMMLHLTRRGYITVSADSYHLTYIESEKDRLDFSRWQDAADELRRDHPGYSGIGKLVSDTRLLIDMLCDDPRADEKRIGIAGHSLGGKMAFYTGCLDDRICAVLASDFGICWDQTNWHNDWYWGNSVNELKKCGMEHAELIAAGAMKPFCLIAGQYDNEESYEMMLKGASLCDALDMASERFCFINHATGHRPPLWALEKGYDFLDKWVKNK